MNLQDVMIPSIHSITCIRTHAHARPERSLVSPRSPPPRRICIYLYFNVEVSTCHIFASSLVLHFKVGASTCNIFACSPFLRFGAEVSSSGIFCPPRSSRPCGTATRPCWRPRRTRRRRRTPLVRAACTRFGIYRCERITPKSRKITQESLD